jgi:hypothetical protein
MTSDVARSKVVSTYNDKSFIDYLQNCCLRHPVIKRRSELIAKWEENQHLLRFSDVILCFISATFVQGERLTLIVREGN